MPLFSTVFFFNGNPIGYNVFEKKPGELALKPAETGRREVNPPSLSAKLVDGNWIINGTNDHSLVEQVRQDLKMNKFLLKQSLIAAP